jgi:hypothetical protein
MAKTLKFLLLISTVLLLASCHVEESDDFQVKNQGNDVTLTQGLNINGTGDVPYPHPAAFKTTGIHGKYFLNSKKTCKKCHDSMDNFSADTSKNQCKTCHEAYPHAPGNVTNHGSGFLKDQMACLKCHDASPKAKPTSTVAPNCKTCHSNFPHENGWVKKHGPQVMSAGSGQCINCHGDAPAEGDSAAKRVGLSCNTCHQSSDKQAPMPHTEYFKAYDLDSAKPANDKDMHHYEYLMGDPSKTTERVKQCASCHKNELSSREDILQGKHKTAKHCVNCHGYGQKDGALNLPHSDFFMRRANEPGFDGDVKHMNFIYSGDAKIDSKIKRCGTCHQNELSSIQDIYDGKHRGANSCKKCHPGN